MRHTLALCLFLVSFPAWCGSLRIEVEDNPALHSKQYLLSQDECKIAWRLQFFQPRNGFGIREEVQCTLPIGEQARLRQALLQKVSDDTEKMAGVRNFVWGNVHNPDIYLPRIARALAASGQWDARHGKLRGKATHNAYFMRDLMNREKVFAELAESVWAQGWVLQVADVEKLQVGPSMVAGLAGLYPVNFGIVFTLSAQK